VICTSRVCVLTVVTFSALAVSSLAFPSEKKQVERAVIQRADVPSPGESAGELENRANELRAAKSYLEALDYYRATLAKRPDSAVLHNKLGITELLCQRFGQAQREFEHAIKLDQRYAAAYNNLGVFEYSRRRYGSAIKQYQNAIRFQPDGASYYRNLGTAYFSKKEWKKAAEAYSLAVSLDSDIFQNTSPNGVAAEILSPEDRAHFLFLLAKLYAKNGLTDRSLETLRRAMEEGYKGIDEGYKDAEFIELRKDPRFVGLMAARPVSIAE